MLTSNSKIVIWGNETCANCKKAFELFTAAGFAVEKKDIEKELEAQDAVVRSEIMSAYTYETILPIVQIDGNAYTAREAHKEYEDYANSKKEV